MSHEAAAAEGWLARGPQKWPSRTYRLSSVSGIQRKTLEDQERARWGGLLIQFVKECKPPLALAIENGEVDPEVASASYLGLRHSTLRLRARRWRKFRDWLTIVKGRIVPHSVYEVA
eukprot:5192036-Amphidinium_carterae.1